MSINRGRSSYLRSCNRQECLVTLCGGLGLCSLSVDNNLFYNELERRMKESDVTYKTLKALNGKIMFFDLPPMFYVIGLPFTLFCFVFLRFWAFLPVGFLFLAATRLKNVYRREGITNWPRYVRLKGALPDYLSDFTNDPKTPKR